MSIAVGNASAAKLIAASTDEHLRQVHNTGTNPVTMGRSSAITAAATNGFVLAGGGTIQVHLQEGEELYGICASTFTSTVEVI
jgi:hypothetical protein